MTYESQEEHDHYELGEATMLGELGSMETNEWAQEENRKFDEWYGGQKEMHQHLIRNYFMARFLPISELKRWVEENEKECAHKHDKCNNSVPCIITETHNSALKALSDRFIKE